MSWKKGQSGNPAGRPLGSKNRFTKFKQDVIDLWEEEGGKEKLREMFKKDEKFLSILDRMISICPKDPVILNEGDTHITYVWSGDKDSRDQVQSSRLSARKP